MSISFFDTIYCSFCLFNISLGFDYLNFRLIGIKSFYYPRK
jgi:hypothetical protein